MTPDAAEEAAELLRQGRAHQAAGRYRAAHDAFAGAILRRPDEADAYRGAADAALAAAKKAAGAGQDELARELRRLAARHWLALGLLLFDRAGPKEAKDAFIEGLKADGESAPLWARLAQAVREGGYPSEAEKVARKALALDRRLAEGHLALAAALADLGRFSEAAAAVRHALALDGLTPATRWSLETGLLLSLHYRDDIGAETVFAAHRDWGRRAVAAAGEGEAPPMAAGEDAERRLRVGYVSGDFCAHPVGRFLVPLLAHHDPAQVESFCYAQVKRPDAVTERLKAAAQHWRDIAALDDPTLRRQIRDDRIDILIDLSGHTGGTRLSVFAVKPAPVTVTWLGYPGTTGLPTIDYRLSDAIADRPGPAERLHTESLMRMPHGFLCYSPPPDAPPLAPPPSLATGRTTFGSFNTIAKVTPAVVALWARILDAVPRSRLVLKALLLRDPGVRERYAALFRGHGIGAGRLELRGPVETLRDHLGAYAEIDIALDPFPYNGTTTTCEALWMGVPVVTLAGDRHAGRVGASLLSRVGLERLIAADPEAYAEQAVRLTGDIAELAAMRTALRERLRLSPLCDAPGFARAFEAALRRMWRRAVSPHGTG